MIAEIVAPAGFLSIAMTRACFVSGPVFGFDDTDRRLCEVALAVFRAVDRVEAFGFDFGLFIGSSEVCATPSAAPPQPRPGKRQAGPDPEAGLSRPSHNSNAPFRPECQSILSKIVAGWVAK